MYRTNLIYSLRCLFLVLLFCPAAQYVFAWDSPIPVPDLGSPRLRIVGQNVENYVHNFEATNASAKNEEEFDAKTQKMANVFLVLQADIVAICEVEVSDTILGYICAAMNQIYGQPVYTFVKDGYDETTTGKVYTGIKAGFIYRKDKVEPYLPSSSPYTESFWMYRLRVQPFRELASGELFSLSMNHFKARSDAESQALRMENAGYLISYLEDIKYDPDILIMGDLNATTDSPEIQKLVSAGYEEQLAKYDPSGCWNIDHIMANSYMADQITGAASYCISYSGSQYRYSDHNAFVVGLNLAKSEVPTAVDQAEMTSYEPVAQKVLIGNSFFILRGEHMYDSQGRMLK